MKNLRSFNFSLYKSVSCDNPARPQLYRKENEEDASPGYNSLPICYSRNAARQNNEISKNSALEPGSVPEFLLSPIPAAGSISISSEERINKVDIYDVLGKQVSEERSFNDQAVNSIDVSDLTNGTYCARIKFMNGKSRVVQIVISK